MSVAVVEPAGLTINDPRRRIFATMRRSATPSNGTIAAPTREGRFPVALRLSTLSAQRSRWPAYTPLAARRWRPNRFQPKPGPLGVGSLTRSRTQYSAGRQSMQLFSSSHGVSRRIPSVCHCSLRRGFSRCDLDARYESKRIHLEGKETV